MRGFGAIVAALVGHWRRHPLELATLLVGLATATALWSGVQALNAEAKASYARAAAVAGGDRSASVTGADGGPVALDDYAALRRLGWPVTPVIEGDLRRDGGESLRLVGIEPLTLPAEAQPDRFDGPGLAGFLLPPHRAFAAPETVARLGVAADLPALAASEGLPPDTLVLDISAADALLGAGGRPTRLLLPEAMAERPLPAGLAERLQVTRAEAGGEVGRLADAFHLNLTAFGLLAFMVGLLIVYAAIGLAFEQRRPMLRTLRACGVSAAGMAVALVSELVLVALVAGAAGVVAGYLVAGALLPDVAASLRGLYGARVPGSLSLGAGWWLAGLGMSLAGALAASAVSLWRAVRLPLLAPARPQAWAEAQRRGIRRGLAAAALLALGTLAALGLGQGLVAGFAAMGGLMLAAALALPAVLAGLLVLGARRARGPLANWAWADARQGLGGLSLALMALLLALAVNVAVGTMVESFRQTFVDYLDRRLAAEAYVTARDADQAAAVADWLGARPEVSAVLPAWAARSRVDDWPVEIFGLRDHATYRATWPLLSAAPDAWDRVMSGDAALVSEQLARKAGLGLGEMLILPGPAGPWRLPVAGTYADYGNTEGQVVVSAAALAAHATEIDRRRVGVRTDPAAVPPLLADLRAAFDLPLAAAVDQRGVKAASLRIFERTFAVTVALNALTLGVAGVALLAALLTLSGARLAQVAPLWAGGVTRRQLAGIELLRALGLAALTALCALPLGLALAWVLTAVVNVRAFGWRLPVMLFPGQWATLFLLALATAAAAAIGPALRLRRAAPADLLRSFSNER